MLYHLSYAGQYIAIVCIIKQKYRNLSWLANSQGMKEAFSTGSQNHQPPQPNS
jgi:hypothetical protein